MHPYRATAARIGGRQHGRVSHAQLIAAGVDAQRIGRWRADGRLRAVHRGVYAVGHEAPSVLGDYMAAVLACGDGALLSHLAIAHVCRLLAGAAPPPEVTVPTDSGRRRPGIVVHRVRELPARDVTVVHGIPATTVPRTLLDLAPKLTVEQLTRAAHEAWVKYRVTKLDVEACIARNPRKHGIAKLRTALGGDVLLSVLERGFLKLLRQHDLPKPRTNIDLAQDKVDCHWPELGLTVELLSFRFHATRQAFEQDVARRRRSNHLAYTYGDVFERGERTAADLRQVLLLR